MLHRLLADHREEMLELAKERMSRQRPASSPVVEVRDANLPAFLDAVLADLRKQAGIASADGPPRIPAGTDDYDIDELVHQYGSLCYSALEIAKRKGAGISLQEHQALNQSLDACIARTVTQWEHDKRHDGEQDAVERLGLVAHELRNALQTATISFQAIRSGHIPIHGITGDLVERSHARLRTMVEQLLTEVRLGAGLRDEEPASVQELLQESIASVSADATEKKIEFAVDADPALEIEGDRALLVSALTNLLQNAVKFTRAGGSVKVRATRAKGRVSISVEDECGGLPPGAAEQMFRPFVQAGKDFTGLGLGLAIARQVVEAHGGSIAVRDLPGRGCVFVVTMPPAGNGAG